MQPTPKSIGLVLEISKVRSVSGEAIDRRRDLYVRPRHDRAAVTAGFDWSESLKRELRSLFLVGEHEMDVAAKAREMGDRLRTFLVSLGWAENGDLEERIADLLTRDGDSPPVPLTLRFGAPELFALPWELVRLPATEICLGNHPGLVLRYEQLETVTAPPTFDPPREGGRILFAWAGEGVGWEEHLEAIADAIGMDRKEFEKEHEVLPSATLDQIDDTLKKRPAAVLHLLCHGVMSSYYDRQAQTDVRASCIVLHGASGEKVEVPPPELHRRMYAHAGSLRLVVLSVCEGGSQGDIENTLGSPAQQAHTARIPSVLGARYKLPIQDSVAFSRTLYKRLHGESQSLEHAFGLSRKALAAHPLSWSNVQLFGRVADGSDHRPFVLRPYKGLKRFQAKDAGWFFGRNEETEKGVQKLGLLVGSWDTPEDRAGSKVTRQLPRFFVISGAAGSGKSSFVQAALLPQWRKERRDVFREEWDVVELLGASPSEASLAKVDALRGRNRRTLVWLDQVEDVFESGESAEKRDTFLRRLYQLASEPSSHLTVIAAARVDWLDRLGEIRIDEAGQSLEELARSPTHGLPLFRMKPKALREVIERPAAKAGLEIEYGLCDRLVEDMSNSPSAHSLLGYVLNLLWEKRRRVGTLSYELTGAAYHEIGGLSGALNRRADEVFEALDDVRRRAAKRLFLQLVEVEASGGKDRRCRVARSRLVRGPNDEAAVFDEVIGRLCAEQLVVVDEVPEVGEQWGRERDEVEIAHESLLRGWNKLRAWLDDTRKKKLDLQQLERWAKELSTLDGPGLDSARTLLATCGDEMTPEARAFVEKSAAAKEAQKLREEAAQRRMEAQLRRATSLSLIASAREALSKNSPSVACLLLCEVPDPTVAAATGAFERLAREVLDSGIPMVTLRGHEGKVTHASFLSGNRLATASADATVRLWSLGGVCLETHKHELPIRLACVDHSGLRAVTAYEGGGARVWSLETLDLIAALPGADSLISVAFSADDEHIVALGEAGNLFYWTASGGLILNQIVLGLSCLTSAPGNQVVLGHEDGRITVYRFNDDASWVVGRHEAKVCAVSVSPDGKSILSGSNDTTARLWSVDGSAAGVVLRGHTGAVVTVGFTPDGKRALTGSADGTACLWSLEGPVPNAVLRHGNTVRNVAFDPERRMIATAGDDGTAQVWRESPSDPLVFRQHTAVPIALAFSGNGRRILTGSLDGTAIVWDGANGSRLSGHTGAVRSVALSWDGGVAFTGSDDGTARLWTGATSPIVLSGHGHPVRAVALSADGLAATGCADGKVRLWKDGLASPPTVLSGHTGAVTSAVFSEDNQHLVTASEDGTARVWNLSDPNVPLTVQQHPQGLTWAALGPNRSGLLARGRESTAWLWVTGDPEVRTIGGSGVHCVAFTPDGAGIVGFVGDAILRVGVDQSMISLPAHPKNVTAAAFSPDIQQLATVAEDCALRVWAVGPTLLQRRLRATTLDCLSPFQRRLWRDETEAEANQHFAACEAKKGRAPAGK